MKPLSPIAHTAGDDSSPLGMRDWLAGARPVAGAATASCLLVVVCSLFAVNAGGLGHRRDVGQPTPVRLQANTADAGREVSRAPARAHARTRAAARTAPTQHTSRTVRDDPVAPASDTQPAGPDATSRGPGRAPAPAPPASATPVSVPTTSEESNFPAPSVEVPTLPVPPPASVVPTVTVPPVPVQVPPIVPTLTTSVNLP